MIKFLLHKKLLLILIIFLGFFYNLTKQIVGSLQANKRLDYEVEQLIKLQTKNAQLKKELAKTQTLEFVEQQARDKLNLARPNETVIIIPETEIERVLALQNKPQEGKIPNWQGWLRLFFH